VHPLHPHSCKNWLHARPAEAAVDLAYLLLLLSPRFAASDRLFWAMLRRVWRGWKQALILVQPETVVRRYRAVFKLYWTWFSRHQAPAGRKRIDLKLRELICCMVAENPGWSAPRIHGELAMLGFGISGRTVLRWMRKAPRSPEPAKRLHWRQGKHRSTPIRR